jgi:predicted nucleic acid-binding protein
LAKERGSIEVLKIYLVDTDILIDHLRGISEALSFFEKRLKEGDEIYYSTISKAEIYVGIRPKEEETTKKLFGLLNPYSVTDKVAEKAGRLVLKYGKKKNLQLPDAIVAASSMELGCELITRNIKDYDLPDVKVLAPYTY